MAPGKWDEYVLLCVSVISSHITHIATFNRFGVVGGVEVDGALLPWHTTRPATSCARAMQLESP
jgi:hypothetical protein